MNRDAPPKPDAIHPPDPGVTRVATAPLEKGKVLLFEAEQQAVGPTPDEIEKVRGMLDDAIHPPDPGPKAPPEEK